MKIAIVVLVCAVSGFAFGTEATEGRHELKVATHSNCNAYTQFNQLTFGGTCFPNQVMTGIYQLNPLEIYCANIQVTCNKDAAGKNQAEQKDQEE